VRKPFFTSILNIKTMKKISKNVSKNILYIKEFLENSFKES
jgi:hypothetical protein